MAEKKQGQLFGFAPRLPEGMVYQTDFITPAEEAALLEEIRSLPLQEAQYKQFTAKRRIMTYGASYDFSSYELLSAGPIPEFLYPLRDRVGSWVGVPASEFTYSLIAEYKLGTQLGWHRDLPHFEIVVGVSLGGPARMRLRRYPHKKGQRSETLSLDLEPRSAYVLRGEARWGWQHSIPPTKADRYSITFRTRSHRGLQTRSTRA
jgi:alkylated DNA repair dioxygenase AlkB